MSSFQLGRSFDSKVETESQYLDSLYKLFRSMFVDCKMYWLDTNKVISFRREEEIDGRHASFWHAISGGSGAECDRELDLNRCIRLGWIGDLLDVFNRHYPSEDNFCWWKSADPRWRNRRFLISTSVFDYIVVVEERSNYVLFITAFYVERSRRRQKLKDEHDRFWNEQEPTTK